MFNSKSRRHRTLKQLTLPLLLGAIGLSILIAAPLSRLARIAALADPVGTRTYFPVVSKNQATPTWMPVPACTPTPAAGTPTPDPNSAEPPRPDFVRVARIVYHPVGDELAGEYVRLENRKCTPVELSGWTLSDSDGSTYYFPDRQLPPGGVLRVWVKGGIPTDTDQYWGSSQPIWDNDGDTAFLRNVHGYTVSDCSYAGGGSERYCP